MGHQGYYLTCSAAWYGVGLLHVTKSHLDCEFMNITICACVSLGFWTLALILPTLDLGDPKCVGTI